jgi:magnesium-transporting ATPase (P-type)
VTGVEEAVDVARKSADIILLSRDLDVLRSGVEDGRRTFANTLKYISITSCDGIISPSFRPGSRVHGLKSNFA